MSQLTFSAKDAMVDVTTCYMTSCTAFTIHVRRNGYGNSDIFECQHTKSGLLNLTIIPVDDAPIPDYFYISGVVRKDNADTVNRITINIGESYEETGTYMVISPGDFCMEGSITIDNRFYLSNMERTKLKYKIIRGIRDDK